MSAELPETVLSSIESGSNFFDDLKVKLSDQIYSTAVYGKINMKRMNSKIFWFAPQIDSLVEFQPVPA